MGNYVGNEPTPEGLVLVGDTNPVGAILWFHAVPNGSYLALNGQTVAKATYPDLWVWAQGFLTADQTVEPGLYRDVDASNFAVPNLAGLFLRGLGGSAPYASAALGLKQADMVGPHTHTVKGTVFNISGGGAVMLWRNNAGDPTDMVVTANAGTENRPVNVALQPCVKALNTTLIASSALPVPPTPSPQLGTPVNATGTAVTIAGIPAGTKMIIVSLSAISLNGANDLRFRMGDAGGIETSGYNGRGGDWVPSQIFSTGDAGVDFSSGSGFGDPTVYHGQITCVLMNATTNLWSITGILGTSNANFMFNAAFTKALSSALTQVQLTTTAGTAAFDAGSINIAYFP